MRTILLVEDNDILRETLRAMLETSGFSVTACSDGQTAVEQAHRCIFDVLLVDFRMPGVNGLEVVKYVREHRPHACIIGMSLENREKSFLAAGADAFLMKPFEIGEMIRITRINAAVRESINN